MNELLDVSANASHFPSDAPASGNCTDDRSPLKRHYLPVIYSLIFLVAFPGNVVAISTYICRRRPWRPSAILLLNLACADLLYLASLPFLIHYYARDEDWVFGELMCKLVRFGFHFHLYSSILFLTCFSIFRYFVIIHPMSCLAIHRTTRWAVGACVAVWLVSLVAVVPMTFLITATTTTTTTGTNRLACLDLSSSDNVPTIKWYNLLLTAVTFCFPLVTVTLCYTTIIHALAQGPRTRGCLKQKARRLAVLLLLVFYVCFLPFHILRVVRIESRLLSMGCTVERQIHEAYIISRPLAALNTFGNLLLYVVVVGDSFQQSICSTVRWRTRGDLEQAKDSSSNNP
ncbi:2-oxoglutarate receptor 1 [Erinaceus europaeus]|uniref:2-oxoglutarate receptor 1 n=1 Tax=Erinaceus europaeus TaxID=9365 RepID=A0A1S3W9E5_ERIEU|nr:2-oxoglutarate receptor 1 [Erinaceus europaeus]